MVGVTTIPAKYSTMYRLMPSILVSFAITLALTIAFAVVLLRAVNRPLETLRGLIEAVGNGDFSIATSTYPSLSGEFRRIADSVRAMAAGLRERDTIKRAFSGYISRRGLDPVSATRDLHATRGDPPR